MKGHTPWIPQSHPAVGAVPCPYCQAPRGLSCVVPFGSPKALDRPGAKHRIGTHVARVRAYDKKLSEQIPTEANPTGPLSLVK